MNWKFLLPGLVFFPSIIAKDIAPAQKKSLSNPAFNFAEVNQGHHKKNSVAVPFWETNKKNNLIDTAALKQSNWYADVVKNIEASEYEIKKDQKTAMYCSPNRQQQLRASFNYAGFTLQPRSAEQAWILKMRLTGIFAEKKLIAQPGENDLPVTGSNKIIFNNTNFSTEYINNKEGIRQNFIIQKEPACKPQTINIKLRTNKNWYINKVHDQELHFAKWQGRQLSKKITYNSLKVWDANNKELYAKFVVNKKHDAFEIEVSTANAVYPITIDPLSSTPDNILDDCNQANANFGISVCSAGDVNGDGYSDVIIGAYSYDDGFADEGKAFVYHGSATGLSATPNNTPDDADQPGANFGYCVASAGDVNGDGYSDVIIGAPYYDDGVNTDEGRAFVYHGSAGGLLATPNSTPDDADQIGASLGFSVACAGDVNGDGFSDVIIGAEAFDDDFSDEGKAFVYYGSATGLPAAPNNTPDDANQAIALFGVSVACAGDVNGDGYSDVIIGAEMFDDGFSDEGKAFVYYGSATGLPLTPNSTPDDADQAAALFGLSVSCAGDVNGDGYSDVIIGAVSYDDGLNTNEGRAFVYYGSAGGLSATPNNTPDDADQAGAFFGISVACAGDVNGDGYSDVIIGAYAYDDAGNIDEGRAFVYYGSSTGLSATPNNTPDDANQVNAQFGISVASAGDVNGDGYSDIIIGANGYNDGANTDEGFAFVYHGSPDGLKTTSNWQVLETQGGANYGGTVASAGDVNSDGYSDVLVGAYIYNQAFNDDGKVFLYLGSAAGLSTTPAWTAFGSMANEYFGRGVAAAGDVNGDGYGDVIVGSYGYTNGQSQEGKVYLYYGTAGGLSAGAAWGYESNVAGAILGLVVAGAGDVNRDGYADIIIGAPQYDDGVTTIDEGKVYFFYGRSTIPDAAPNWSVESNQTGGWFGVSVAGLGDVNGDGYSDIIFGAQLYDDGVFIDEGQAFAYYGSATGLPATPDWTAKGNQVNAQFGICVSSAGDVNGDGYSDAIVGATFYDNGTSDEGGAFLYYGSSSGLSSTISWSAESNIPSSYFGYYLSSAGDVNGDGYSDVLVGAREISNGQSREGALYAYYGSSTGLSLSTSWYVESNVATSLLGNSVASAGDVNGDGYSDVIGGAPYYGGLNGAAFVYYGNNNTGLRHNLKLYNTDLTTPINRSNILVPNLFGAGLFTKSSLGRVKGKLVWEVKQQGQPFSGNPITNSTSWLAKGSYTDLGIAGTELKYQVQKVGLQNKIRVRVEYDKATAITGQVYGPWRYPPAYLQGAHGMSSIPLPVKLNSFTGALIADKVQLQWISADDENVANYEIERSNNARDFTGIGQSGSVHKNNYNYHFTDDQPLKGKSWYRLKITDVFNRTNYSGMVLIKNTTAVVSVYPTIISRGQPITLQFKNNITGPIEIQLLNNAGSLVFKKIITANGALQNIDLPALPTGVYILSANQNSEKLITQKVIIR